ncbi:MAG TPA: tautomerase family protein [Bacteroidales bacterium]|nr:tautomerase family protein [Bacteroidales bacterium]
MPLVKIELRKGKTVEFKSTLMDTVHESLVEILMIPENDKNQRLIEYDAGCFDSKPPYGYFIELTMFSGRTKETKKKLFSSIVNKLQEKMDIDPQSVLIVINEQPTENWGVRGGIPASEVKMDFKIEI